MFREKVSHQSENRTKYTHYVGKVQNFLYVVDGSMYNLPCSLKD